MAQIVDINEIRKARREGRVGNQDRGALERAVELLRQNLAAVAMRLSEAPPSEQVELLDRVEKLAAMIRYGLLMLGEIPPRPELEERTDLRPA